MHDFELKLIHFVFMTVGLFSCCSADHIQDESVSVSRETASFTCAYFCQLFDLVAYCGEYSMCENDRKTLDIQDKQVNFSCHLSGVFFQKGVNVIFRQNVVSWLLSK